MTKYWTFLGPGPQLYAFKSSLRSDELYIDASCAPKAETSEEYYMLIHKCIEKHYDEIAERLTEGEKTQVKARIDFDDDLEERVCASYDSVESTRVTRDGFNVVPKNYKEVWASADNFSEWYHSLARPGL